MKNNNGAVLAMEIVVALSVFVVVNLLSAKFQPVISRQHGRPWESLYYYNAAEAFSHGQKPAGPGPWISRIGTSYLASLLPNKDLMRNFLIVNIVANAIATFLFLAWIRFYITSWKIRVLLMLMFLLPFNSLARRVYYCPVTIDHWDKVFLLAGLIGIHKLKSWGMSKTVAFLSVVAGIGVIFRGVMMLIPLALLFVDNPIQFNKENFTFRIRQWPRKILYVPFIFGFIGVLFCNRVVIAETSSYATMRMMGRVIYEMLLSTYVLGWFIAYGPILVLVVYNWRSSLKYLMEHQYQLIVLLSVIILAWLGGSSVNRYAFWVFPIIYVMIGKAMEENVRELMSPLFIGVLGISQIVAQRVFMIWPDYPSTAPWRFPVFTPLGNNVPMLDVIGIGVSVSNFIALNEYLLFSVMVLLYLYYRGRRISVQRVNGGR
jgi:hypothetical protein